MPKAPLPPISPERVLASARRHGHAECNPLSYRDRRWAKACFRAVSLGLVRSERVNAGRYLFFPVEVPHAHP